MNWSALLIEKSILLAVIAVPALRWAAKMYIENWLKKQADQKLEELKAQLADKNNKGLEEVRHEFQKKLDEEKRRADQQSAVYERRRSQMVEWENPLLGAVSGLGSRLNNILEEQGYLALNKTAGQTDPDWSADYDYFLKSTMYLFAQYFCWIRLVELELSPELFRTKDAKEDFRKATIRVSKSLGDYPPTYTGIGPDRQIFRLQQQAIGELLIAGERERRSCMGYAAFLQQISSEQASSLLVPLRLLVDNLQPDEKRWNRMQAARDAVANLKEKCERLLNVDS